MNTEQELLPCPFCGGEAIMQDHPPHRHSDWLVKLGMPEHSPGSFTVECVACECGMIHETREGVIAAWNRRAALQSQDREDAVQAAINKLSAMTPRHPKAITYDQGWEIINVVQFELCPAIDHARRIEGDGK